MGLRGRLANLRASSRELLKHDGVRAAVGRARHAYFTRVLGRLRTVQGGNAVFEKTVSHNLGGLGDHANLRMRSLVLPLASIECVAKDARILVIGPRTESDLLLLVGLGFDPARVRGLDLVSYSPHIDVGDMHSMPYPDASFDVVLCGWTLSYSSRPERAADEILRVTRRGGVIGLAIEYCSVPPGRPVGGMGYAIEPEGFKRLNAVGDLLSLFDGSVETVFFSHDAPLRRSHTEERLVDAPSSVILIFQKGGA